MLVRAFRGECDCVITKETRSLSCEREEILTEKGGEVVRRKVWRGKLDARNNVEQPPKTNTFLIFIFYH